MLHFRGKLVQVLASFCHVLFTSTAQSCATPTLHWWSHSAFAPRVNRLTLKRRGKKYKKHHERYRPHRTNWQELYGLSYKQLLIVSFLSRLDWRQGKRKTRTYREHMLTLALCVLQQVANKAINSVLVCVSSALVVGSSCEREVIHTAFAALYCAGSGKIRQRSVGIVEHSKLCTFGVVGGTSEHPVRRGIVHPTPTIWKQFIA